MTFDCPHCKQPTITLKQKYLSAKWVDVYCHSCGGRSCMFPVLLVLLYFFYTWDIMLFGYIAWVKSSIFYLSVMAAGWMFLDVVGLWIPLARLKPRQIPA